MRGEALILGGARTPFAAWSGGTRGDGAPGGALKELDPFDLGAAALKGALERSGVKGSDLDLVVFTNVYAVGAHACYGGRYPALRAGIPDKVPALSVSMACGSGLWALICGAQQVGSGAGLVAVGAGDSSSRVPRAVLLPSFTDLACDQPIGRSVDALAREHGVSRQVQDDWALRSHTMARRAQREGRLAGEIVETGGVREDDALLPDPSPEPFRRAEPLYDGGVTKANSHALVDGGSALVLAQAGARTASRPLGRFKAGAVAAVAPERMGYASVPAVRRTLEEAGWKGPDVDLWEINETFAAQTLIDQRELGIDPERLNVNGGALALGHPFAATGLRQVLSLLLELGRRGLKRGIASICVGGGLGVAVAVEAA